MTKALFSDVFLRAIQPPSRGQIAFWDKKIPSFGLRVSQGGSKTFVLNRRNNLITIGRYPLISLSDARTEAKRLLAEFTLGKVRPQSVTFPEAVGLFIEDKKRSRRPNTYEGYEWFLSRLGLRGQITQITHADMARALSRITSRSTYNHALVAARIFFNWCIKRRYIEHNPTTGLSPHATTPRTRVLSDHEIKCIWQATERPSQYNAIVRLLLLTGQRRNEIVSLQSSWIKDDILTIPATVAKNARENIIPLGPLALSILGTITTTGATHTLLFSARGASHSTFSGWSKAKAALDRRLGGTVENWTLHDLRRYYASIMASLGVKQEVTERLLNHRSGIISGIAAVYTRYDFLPEMRAAIDLYQKHLQRLFEN